MGMNFARIIEIVIFTCISEIFAAVRDFVKGVGHMHRPTQII